MIATAQPLTNLQLELLKLYSLRLSESDLIEVKRMLARYFSDRLNKHVDSCGEKKD